MADDQVTQQRNDRLDALQESTEQWAQRQTDYLNSQVAFGKRVLQERTGSERLAQAPVQSVSALAVDQINDFLTGE